VKPPREQGAREFQGMDTALAPTAQAMGKAVLDLGGNHDQQGAWATRRGFARAFLAPDSTPVNAVSCWIAENGIPICLISTDTGYYIPEGISAALPTTGYGINGYGSQNYGD